MEGSSEAPYDIENPRTPLLTSMSQTQELLASMSLTQENDSTPLSDPCCIYRVPKTLRCVNEKAYTPQVVSIGPLHHGKKGLKEMEGHKKRYLQYFLERTGVSKEYYKTEIKGKEAELRSCYAHTIKLCSEKFVEIILVDAAFIIEFLLRFVKDIVPDSNDRILDSNDPILDSNDRIFNKPWLKNYIPLDMLLLENQLPFFILEVLFATVEVPAMILPSVILKDLFATAEVPAMLSVFDLSYIFCKASTSLYINKKDSGSSSSFKVEHFVDLIRTLNLPTDEEGNENRGSVDTPAVPSMTKLHQAGVKFEAASSNNLFDICFKDGTLKIPHLEIDDNTELVLRNLIAFEQCHCSDTHYFIDYILLMDYLVNTANDVELLLKNRIVEHLLGDHSEVSTLINSLGKGVVVNRDGKFKYATLVKDLSDYYKYPWNKWKADLKQKYFKSPWTIISVLAAALIIILTIIQTVCSFPNAS